MQENQVIEETKEEVKTYPTKPDAEGFFYEDEGSEALGIEKKEENGDVFYRAKLTDGRVAIIRELTGEETQKAKSLAGGKPEKMEAAYASIATLIDGQPIFLPDLLSMKARNFNKIITASNLINFM